MMRRTSRTAVTVVLLLFIMFFSGAVYAQERQVEVTGSYSGFDKIYEKYGVEIITDTSQMIPDPWLQSPIDGKASPISSDLYEKATSMIEGALKEYPKRFLKEHLHSISLVDSLSFYDVAYGGTATYAYHGIIIVTKDWNSEDWFIETIHHELNHLLVHHNNFPESQWNATNKPGFQYGGGGVEAIRNGQSSTEHTDSAFRDGFVNQYGKSAFVEDVATIVEYAIGDRAGFIKRTANYPILTRKYELIKQFYYSLDPWFDESFWTGYKQYEESDDDNTRTDDYNNYQQDTGFTVESISFYEYYNEDYLTYSFDGDTTTRVGYTVILENPDSLDTTITIQSWYYYPDGTEMGNFNIDYNTEGYTRFSCSWSFGWDDPGYWSIGEYRVVLYLDDEYLTEGAFSIY